MFVRTSFHKTYNEDNVDLREKRMKIYIDLCHSICRYLLLWREDIVYNSIEQIKTGYSHYVFLFLEIILLGAFIRPGTVAQKFHNITEYVNM
jgi:hypothetical protein